MQVALQRDPEWWVELFTHPAVAPGSLLGGKADFAYAMAIDPLVMPLATEHGGFIFLQRDGLGTVFELHTAFRPEGWGRHVTEASHAAFSRLFSGPAQVVFTWETRHRQSRPPLSHGWRPAGPFQPIAELAAEARAWVLTRDAWDTSPARSRRCRHLQEQR